MHRESSQSLQSIDESSEFYSVDSDTLNAAMSRSDPVAKPSYKDYFKAQRSLHHLHRHPHHHHHATPPNSSSKLHSHQKKHHHHHVPPPPTSRRQQLTDQAYENNLKSMAMLGQRNSPLSDANSLWGAEVSESFGGASAVEVTMNENYHHHGEDHHHHGKIPNYAPPMQRVFYGKPQVLPHVNWGDLFFDLFFVAAAYNLGTMLISSLNDTDWLRGAIYFVGIFGSLFATWYNDLAFSSRYTVLDHFHRLIWGFKFFTVGGAILFVTPLNLLADPHSFETIGFVSCILLEALISAGLQFEVYWKAMGDRVPIKNHSKRTLLNYYLPTVILYTVALVLAILAYPKEEEEDAANSSIMDDFGNSTTIDGVRRDLAAPDVSCSSGSRLLLARMLGATTVDCTGRRFLAASSSGDDCSCHTGVLLEMRDLPLGLICFAYFFNIFFSLFRSMCLASGEGKDIRDLFVPNNLDYVVHRYGEWIMLMIGESILSLLIVDPIESSDYFVIACLGVLNVMCVHTLIFESQPSSSVGHAVFRSFNGQLAFGLLVQLLSLGLVALGTCLKIMLSTVLAEGTDYRRRLAVTTSVSNEMTSKLFSLSLSVILISLELMLVTHKGTKESFARLWKNKDGGAKGMKKKIHKPLLALNVAKIGLIVFVATLSQWEDSLTEISWIGLMVVFGMLVSRPIAWELVHKEDRIREMFQNSLNIVLPEKQQQEEQDPLYDIEEGQEEESKEVTVNRDTWDKSDDCIIVLNKSRNIKYANKTTLTEFGYTSELDLIGKDISVLGNKDGEETKQEVGNRREVFKKLESHLDSWNESMDMVVVIDRKGIIDFTNTMTLQEFGYGSEEELIGKDIALLVGGGEASKHGAYMKALHSGKIPSKVIGLNRASSNKSGKKRLLYAKRKDGTEFPCMIGLKPIGTEHIAGFIKNLSDLSSMHSKEAFIAAASEGNVDDVKRYLATNSGVGIDEGDYDKRTALHLAADYGHGEVIQILCEAGANVNVEDKWGHRPLDDAICGQHKDCIVLLKKFGAERGRKQTVADLIDASAKGASHEVTSILEEGDVDMNGCDYDGRTALHLAACEGNVQVLAVLCEAGANLDVLDRWNRTPLDEAELHGQVACMEMLRKFGAKGRSKSPDDAQVVPPEVVDETADSIIVSNYDGVIQKLNKTALASFGYDSDVELIGHDISILVQDEFVRRKSFGGSPQTQRVLHGKHKSGSKFPCIVYERKDEERRLLISCIKDVSDLTRRGSLSISQNIEPPGLTASSRCSSGSIAFNESSSFRTL